MQQAHQGIPVSSGAADATWQEHLPAPFVVMCRGASGSRFLAEVLTKNGLWMGDRLNESFDSFLLLEKLVVPFMNSDAFPLASVADGGVHGHHASTVEDAFADFLRAYPGGPWGWKLPESVFIVPLVKHCFPRATFIHLIRDGRDVILSDNGLFGLPFRRDGLIGFPFLYFLRSGTVEELHRRLWPYLNRRRSDDYLLKTIFNASQPRSWNGIPVNRANVRRIRYQLGMLSWMNHVRTARRYRTEMPGDYHEVRYEDLCTQPVETLERLLAGLGMDLTDEARDCARSRAHRRSIGKWRDARLPPDLHAGFQEALDIGRPLLTELGYE